MWNRMLQMWMTASLQTLKTVNLQYIYQGMWTYTVTCCADCIRLLAGRGMNICHEVWSLSTVMQPHTVYSKHKELLQLCYWKHNVNPTYGADLEHWTIIFGPVTTLERSPIVQQEEFRSLISALTDVNSLPRWDNHVRCCGVVSVK